MARSLSLGLTLYKAALVVFLLSLPAAAAAEESALQLSAFVDAYAAWQSNAPGTLASLSEHRAFSGQGASGRSENGLSLAWQGAGLSQRPNLGGAVTYEANDALTFSLGAVCALDQTRNDDEGYDVFGDFVTTFELPGFLAALNVDYIFTHSDRHFIGASLTTGFKLSEAFRIAARAEYLRDQASFDGQTTFHLFTGTLTFDIRPVPERDYLIVRWEIASNVATNASSAKAVVRPRTPQMIVIVEVGSRASSAWW